MASDKKRKIPDEKPPLKESLLDKFDKGLLKSEDVGFKVLVNKYESLIRIPKSTDRIYKHE